MISTLLPEGVTAITAVVLVIASFFTSAITAAAGIGGGLLMLALMTYLIPIVALIPVHGLVQLGSNASRTWVQRENVDRRIAAVFMLGSGLGALTGALIAVRLQTSNLQILLGVFILALVWVRFPPIAKAGNGIVAAGGALTTFVSMFVGATGPLVAVFLKNLFSEHRKLAATHGATMMGQHGVKILAFGLAGFAFAEWIALVLVMILSGFLGVKAGTQLMNRLPERVLKLAFNIILTLAALDLLRRGLSEFASS